MNIAAPRRVEDSPAAPAHDAPIRGDDADPRAAEPLEKRHVRRRDGAQNFVVIAAGQRNFPKVCVALAL